MEWINLWLKGRNELMNWINSWLKEDREKGKEHKGREGERKIYVHVPGTSSRRERDRERM